MKILTIHNLLWPHYKNALFSEVQKQAAAAGITWNFVQIARNEISRKEIENDTAKYPPQYHYDLLFDDFIEHISSLKIFRALLQRLNYYKPDVLNLTGFNAWYLLLILMVARSKGIKVVISNDSTQNENEPIWWKMILKKWAVKNASGFFCFGTKAVEYMLELGAKDSEILARHCGVVDNDQITKVFEKAKKQNTRRAFIFIGRMIAEKNLDVLIEAFAKLQNPGWDFIMMGSGDKLEEYKLKVKSLNIAGQVKWIDGKPWYQIPEFLAMADVLVLPSKSETWGLVVNEAMVCKMPVIVSDKCGCWYDLVPDNQTGFVFPYQSAEALTEAFRKFADNPELITEMGTKAHKLIQQFSVQSAASEMINGVKSL